MNKKFLALILCVSLSMGSSAWAAVTIDSTTFPDSNFRNFIATTKFDKDGDRHLSDEEIASITELDLTLASTAMETLKGIEYLTALTELDCYGKNITTLDVSQNTSLDSLLCHDNSLTSLILGNNTTLTKLDCYNNKLQTLDVSGCTSLTQLYCNNNKLQELNIENNTKLKYLWAENNRLATLDVTSNPEISMPRYSPQTVSTDALSEDEYGYTFDFSSLLLSSLQVSLISDVKAFDESGNEIEVSISDKEVEPSALYFDEKPSSFTYKYNIGYKDDELMDVTVKFLASGESDEETTTNLTPSSGGGGGGGCNSGFSVFGLLLVSMVTFRKRK